MKDENVWDNNLKHDLHNFTKKVNRISKFLYSQHEYSNLGSDVSPSGISNHQKVNIIMKMKLLETNLATFPSKLLRLFQRVRSRQPTTRANTILPIRLEAILWVHKNTFDTHVELCEISYSNIGVQISNFIVSQFFLFFVIHY